MNPFDAGRATHLKLLSAGLLFVMVVSLGAGPGFAYDLPKFRSVSADQVSTLPPGTGIRLLMDQDFTPYSFVSVSGAPAGIAIELAFAACAEIKVHCEAVPLPFDDLRAVLARGDGDLIVSGPRIDEDTLSGAIMTRPWFRLMGRFAMQSGSPLQASDPTSLAGKRIGVVKDTTHARWLETYYARAEIVPFDDEAAAGEALRTGNVEVLFGDNLRLIYWVAGQGSTGCCRLVGGAYTDFDHFSRNLAFLAAPGRTDIRDAFDHGLDLAQESGATGRIFNAYVPLSPW
jgi:polar amino acid transport system substrate-binding protein